jgi:hypothetical protein
MRTTVEKMGPSHQDHQLSLLSLQMSTDKQYDEQLEAPMEATVIQSVIGTGPNGITYIPGGEAEKRLLWKIDRCLVPVVWFSECCSSFG